MTNLKDSHEKKSKKEEKIKNQNKTPNDFGNNNISSSCCSKERLQICVWLAIGLGIFCTTFYFATKYETGHRYEANAMSNLAVKSRSSLSISEHLEEGLSDIEQFKLENSEQKLNDSGRLSINNLYETIERNLNHCQEESCQIVCASVTDIFTVLDDTIKNSSCSSIDVLLLENQNFPLGVLKNYWQTTNTSFNEVIIRFSKTTSIISNAFNSPLFENTLVLSLFSKNFMNIESEAFLGLSRLKYLTIQSNLKKFQSSILQPVENTLLSLKLKGRLKINGAENIFESSYFNNLAYLDLSNNLFNGSLGKELFDSTPNLKYLIITQSQIKSIESDAFANLADKLLFVNLSKNRLTTLTAEVFKPILLGHHKAVINLVENRWLCDCQLKEFAKFYKIYNLQFMHVLYCKGPHHLYGASLDEVDFSVENCGVGDSTEVESFEETGITTTDYEDGNTSIVELSTPSPFNLKMRCFDDQERLKLIQSQSLERHKRSSNEQNSYMMFPPPDYEFYLELIAENNSVIVAIEESAETYLVIWFSEEEESSVISNGDTDLDYECMRYDQPQLIVGPLQENTTYTFCVLNSMKNDISPFNCLPLHVPPKTNTDIWITEDKKHFTIGMLCLIFSFSAIAGAVIAYFGLKTYPELLESSKGALIEKEADQNYVTTISELEYQKHKPCIKQQSIKKLPLPETPTLEKSPSPFGVSIKDLERISSVKSSSTCFEDILPSYNLIVDDYETPKICSDEYTVEQRSVENTYSTTPRSPPPLPKRNSNISNSSTLSLNRLSKN